jgi:hypothetical protein
MNNRATENSILKFLTVSSVSIDSIVKGIMLRKASIRYLSEVYSLSYEKYKWK